LAAGDFAATGFADAGFADVGLAAAGLAVAAAGFLLIAGLAAIGVSSFFFGAVGFAVVADAALPDFFPAVDSSAVASDLIVALELDLAVALVLGLAILACEAFASVDLAAVDWGLSAVFTAVFTEVFLGGAASLEVKSFLEVAFFADDLLLTLEAWLVSLAAGDSSRLPFSLVALDFFLECFKSAATNSSFFIDPAPATPSCLAAEASSFFVLEFKSAAVDKIETPAGNSND
jgi:hypothetical protein